MDMERYKWTTRTQVIGPEIHELTDPDTGTLVAACWQFEGQNGFTLFGASTTFEKAKAICEQWLKQNADQGTEGKA
jgi:hypothetical protein